jgi:uncharacterized membrane protein AbrB (regulator of aidB expression)
MVGFEVFDLLAGLFYQISGNPLIATAILTFFIITMLAIFRAPISVMLMVLVPLIIGFVLNSAFTNFIQVPTWILIVVFMALGLMFSLMLYLFSK